MVAHHSGPLLIKEDQLAVVVPLPQSVLAQHLGKAEEAPERPAALPSAKRGKLKLHVQPPSEKAREDPGQAQVPVPMVSVGSQVMATKHSQSPQLCLVDWLPGVGYLVNGPITLEPVDIEEPLSYMLVITDSVHEESI